MRRHATVLDLRRTQGEARSRQRAASYPPIRWIFARSRPFDDPRHLGLHGLSRASTPRLRSGALSEPDTHYSATRRRIRRSALSPPTMNFDAGALLADHRHVPRPGVSGAIRVAALAWDEGAEGVPAMARRRVEPISGAVRAAAVGPAVS